jgi:rhodanese-related sulfurtransferase
MKESVILFVLFSIWACSHQGSGSNDSVVSPQVFSEKIKAGDVIVLDVRTPEEMQTGYLEGAQNMNFSSPDFEKSLDNLDHSKKYCVYCLSGKRSGKALEMMKAKGFQNVTAMEGGLNAWKSAGLPLQKQ